jgi:hypothetical protein
VVRPASHGVPRAPCYSGTPLNGALFLSPTGLSPSVVNLSRFFDWEWVCNPSKRPQPRDESRFGLFPLSLAATYGIDISFFSCRYLDVSVPCVRSTRPMRSGGSDGRLFRRVSTFRNLRIDARLPAPRSFSQAAASFVASRCQDIHRTPLRVWPHLSIIVLQGLARRGDQRQSDPIQELAFPNRIVPTSSPRSLTGQ